MVGMLDPNGGFDPYTIFINALLMYILIFTFMVIFGVYSTVWRYTEVCAYFSVVFSCAAGGIYTILITQLLSRLFIGYWRNAAVAAVFCLAILCSRFIYQYLHNHSDGKSGSAGKIGVAIVGAGRLGTTLSEELKYSPMSQYKPVCFIDYNKEKIGAKIGGLKVYASDDKTINLIKSLPIQEIFIAISTINSDDIKKLYDFYSKTGCKVKIYDSPFKNGDSERRVIRDIHLEDLLFRDSLTVIGPAEKEFYADKTVLITGGGGSIGSEICRQIAKLSPKRIVILDVYENNAYEIQQELIIKYGESLDLVVVIGSIRDRKRLDSIFAFYRPDVVFHAAAHKHVPLMESSACEAIQNNVLGTYNTADMAEKYGVQKFVLISTDKAVNPTNVMGASKRLCEMVIQCRYDSKTSFAAVRFGNVLGSNGSVIPLFKKQIENGGPVTITDKRIIRYFMTISEAAQLVIDAGVMAKTGELFVLNMGKPIKILDLAENMIKLSGFRPYIDIDIKEIGLRPGEKLYEELLIKPDISLKTNNDLIYIEHDIPLTRSEFDRNLTDIIAAMEKSDIGDGYSKLICEIKKVVTTFCDPEIVNSSAKNPIEVLKSKGYITKSQRSI